MKCIVLSNSSYKKKDGSGTGSIANVVYLRNGLLNVQQVFGLDPEKVEDGCIVDIQVDLKGFLMSYDVLGSADSFPLIMDELFSLYS